ncbi:MAG: substrate-binding domain-containing protein [Clostridiales bacterium]|nr:substrate-binding domain-containing protein [Clostridiales bacterium]
MIGKAKNGTGRKLLASLIVLILLSMAAACTPQTADLSRPSATPSFSPSPAPSSVPVFVPEPTPDPDEPISYANFPVLDGSTATIPLAMALIREFTGCSEMEAETKIRFSTTDDSYRELSNGSADLLLVYEASEQTKERWDVETTMDVYPIGLDALVFIVNENNPIDSLTTAQIRDIYSGKVTNWKEVGGADIPIEAFQRPPQSGSQTMMEKLVMGELPMADTPTEFIIAGMEQLIDEIAAAYVNAGNAIGYSVYYYAKNMYALPGLKFIAVDGAEPNEKSIGSRSYPHINEFFGVLPKEPTRNAKYLLDWLLTEDGQRFVASCGYVPALPVAEPAALVPKGGTDTDLWDSSLYALLYGEGESLLVYDSKGRLQGSITQHGYGSDNFSAGLYSAQELADLFLYKNGIQKAPAPDTIHLPTRRYQDGFTRFDWTNGLLYIYDKAFELRYTVPCEPGMNGDAYAYEYAYTHQVCVLPIDNKEFVYLRYYDYGETTFLIRPQLRSRNGEFVSYVAFDDTTFQVEGVFAEKYWITKEANRSYSIRDMTGRILAENVHPVQQPSYEGSYGMRSVSYYKEGMLYDANLRAYSPAHAVSAIDGIPSTGSVIESAWGDFIYGYADGKLHAKRGDTVYHFEIAYPAKLVDFNDNFVFFFSAPDRCEVHFLNSSELFSARGSEYSIYLSEEYFIAYDTDTRSYQVIDAYGQNRYGGPSIRLFPLSGELILMGRGPYYGIADLDGNWVIKTLLSYLADDGWYW